MTKAFAFAPDERAFIDAYLSNVAEAPQDVVVDFLLMEDEHFYEKYGTEYYTGLADAWGVWWEARRYEEVTV